ncbi:DUF481 domain-containing protein [Achromobacter aloeverae]|uniref:DUF481 domain-containing protein n=1 Tax=Achromobacter aloeverae TaxID=1750518 RepID=A0A4V1MS82_9BURK|nr:DUF481 domain-containing protein [Achromobacter aloeverae]RXN90402.1 DUF481 domain-containing protein [Achromobacter aloeverae]
MPALAMAQRAKRHDKLLLLLVFFMAMLRTAAALADTVWMDNGDHLTGTIKSLDGGFLLVSTPYAGDVRIDFKHVTTLQSAGPLTIRDKDEAREYKAKLVRGDPGKVTLAGTIIEADDARAVQASVPLNTLDSINRQNTPFGDTSFKGRLDASVVQTQSATTSQVYAVALNAEARQGLWRNRLSFNYNRDKDDHTLSVNNYGGNYTLDRFFTDKAFWQFRGLYRGDTVEEVRRQIAYGTGPGYQFWDNELGAFSMSALVGRVNYRYDDGTGESSYAGALRWDYSRYLSGKKFEIYTKGELLRPFDANAQFSINGEAGLRYNINNFLSLYVKYARDQVSGTRQTMNESIYSTGIGLSW